MAELFKATNLKRINALSSKLKSLDDYIKDLESYHPKDNFPLRVYIPFSAEPLDIDPNFNPDFIKLIKANANFVRSQIIAEAEALGVDLDA